MTHVEFLNFLVCPKTKEELLLNSLEIDGNERVKYGVLISSSGYAYPIINYIPRTFEGAWGFYKDKLNTFQIENLNINEDLNLPSKSFKNNILPTLYRFQKEWEKHEIKNKTWGWSQQDRIKKYREYMQLSDEFYHEKLFLDLGAGTGQLTATLAKKLKGTFIGLDLTPGIEKGNQIVLKNNQINCYFVQANLLELPFKNSSFDFVHASGVLHHTPNTYNAFKIAEKSVKKGGKFGVWLYRHREGSKIIPLPIIPFTNITYDGDKLRKYTTKMNPNILYNLIFLYTLIFHAFYKLNELIRNKKHNQTIKERTTSIFDSLAPEFAHKHKVEEVKDWYQNSNYNNLNETDLDNKSGFNLVGTKL